MTANTKIAEAQAQTIGATLLTSYLQFLQHLYAQYPAKVLPASSSPDMFSGKTRARACCATADANIERQEPDVARKRLDRVRPHHETACDRRVLRVPFWFALGGTILLAVASIDRLSAAENQSGFLVGIDQPRRTGFRPLSRENRLEQRRIGHFDARQRRMQRALDKKLTICNC